MPPPLVQLTCVRCAKKIDAEDVFCRYCGGRQGGGDSWYYSVLGIAFLAFLVIGPFALVLVWKSTRMGVVAKRVLGGLIVVYSVATAYYFYRLIVLVSAQMRELSEVLGSV